MQVDVALKCCAKLDLNFADEFAVLSSTTDTMQLMITACTVVQAVV